MKSSDVVVWSSVSVAVMVITAVSPCLAWVVSMRSVPLGLVEESETAVMLTLLIRLAGLLGLVGTCRHGDHVPENVLPGRHLAKNRVVVAQDVVQVARGDEELGVVRARPRSRRHWPWRSDRSHLTESAGNSRWETACRAGRCCRR